jgi:protein farnesyltransferase subunit beta
MLKDRLDRSTNRASLYDWIMRLKHPDGSFTMHVDGEVDIRGSYCALVVARLCNIITDALKENVAEFISR